MCKRGGGVVYEVPCVRGMEGGYEVPCVRGVVMRCHV